MFQSSQIHANSIFGFRTNGRKSEIPPINYHWPLKRLIRTENICKYSREFMLKREQKENRNWFYLLPSKIEAVCRLGRAGNLKYVPAGPFSWPFDFHSNIRCRRSVGNEIVSQIREQKKENVTLKSPWVHLISIIAGANCKELRRQGNKFWDFLARGCCPLPCSKLTQS